MKINIAYITSFLLMLSLGNSYSATFDYDFTNVNNCISTNSLVFSFFNKQFVASSLPYYYLVGATNTSLGFYLSQYNYVSNQDGWTKNWGTTNALPSRLYNVTVTPDGSCLFVSGYIYTNYDGQTNIGGKDIYVAKLSADNGTKEWSRIFGSTNTDQPISIALDSNTNIFVLAITIGSVGTNVNKGEWDLLLAKYNYDGSNLWTKMWGSASNDVGRDIAVDASNNVYLLGDTQWNVGNQTNSGLCDMFLIKADNDGNTQWTKMIGTSSNDYASALAIDGSNNVVIYGYTDGNLNGQSHTGKSNIAILKLDSDGSNIWTKVLGSPNYYYNHFVSPDLSKITSHSIILNQNNIYLSATIISTTNIADYTTLIKLANNGSNIWTKKWTTGLLYQNTTLSEDSLGNLFIASDENFPGYEIRTLFQKYDLIISSSTNQHGTNSLPFNYGTNRMVGTTTFTNSIADEYPVDGTRYTCTGYNGSGSIATSGLTNTVAFCLTNNSTLTWNWQRQYYVSVSNTAGCSVNYIRGTNEWNNEGTELILSAYPQVYFKYWQIEPIHASPTDNPKSLPPLTQPLSIVANFGWEDNGHGIAWEWKVLYWGTDIGSYNPTQTSDCNDDGFTDYEAYLAGINPTNGNIFAITGVSISNGFPVISWKNDYTTYGRYFTIMAKDELMSTSWSILGSVFAAGNGSYTDTNAHSHAFYKVVVGIK